MFQSVVCSLLKMLAEMVLFVLFLVLLKCGGFLEYVWCPVEWTANWGFLLELLDTIDVVIFLSVAVAFGPLWCGWV